jgi:hypothetical protein
MKSKRGLELVKKNGQGQGAAMGGDKAAAGEGQDCGVVKKAAADQGRQPEGLEDGDDSVVHNGSAGAFVASEDGHYEEDSDEDNDDLAMGR